MVTVAEALSRQIETHLAGLAQSFFTVGSVAASSLKLRYVQIALTPDEQTGGTQYSVAAGYATPKGTIVYLDLRGTLNKDSSTPSLPL